jgi:hypothetical protein
MRSAYPGLCCREVVCCIGFNDFAGINDRWHGLLLVVGCYPQGRGLPLAEQSAHRRGVEGGTVLSDSSSSLEEKIGDHIEKEKLIIFISESKKNNDQEPTDNVRHRRVKKLALLSSRNVPRQPWPLISLVS